MTKINESLRSVSFYKEVRADSYESEPFNLDYSYRRKFESLIDILFNLLYSFKIQVLNSNQHERSRWYEKTASLIEKETVPYWRSSMKEMDSHF